MKKLILLNLIVFTIFTSCVKPLPSDSTERISHDIDYFIDNEAGLCFAVFYSNGYKGTSTTSVTCVPCDSIKRFLEE